MNRAAALAPMPALPADRSEYAEWVRPHLPAMSRLAARLAPNGDRDDVVQEALVRAWTKRSQWDPVRGSAAGWLLAIVADRARHARRRSAAPQGHLVASPPPDQHHRLDLDRALDRLTVRQRLAVDCFYYADLSIAQTAQVMGCTEGTVKSTLADARARLRPLLEVSS